MPHPKRRHSSTRKKKRRTHDKAPMPNFAICPTTGEHHLPHRGYWHQDKFYYKGKVFMIRDPK